MSRKLLMYVTKKSDKLNIDNRTLSVDDIQNKITEEFREVQIAIDDYRIDKTLSKLRRVVEETFNLIQVCILVLWRADRKAGDFDEADLIENVNADHNDKLVYRKWTFDKGIKIDVKE